MSSFHLLFLLAFFVFVPLAMMHPLFGNQHRRRGNKDSADVGGSDVMAAGNGGSETMVAPKIDDSRNPFAVKKLAQHKVAFEKCAELQKMVVEKLAAGMKGSSKEELIGTLMFSIATLADEDGFCMRSFAYLHEAVGGAKATKDYATLEEIENAMEEEKEASSQLMSEFLAGFQQNK